MDYKRYLKEIEKIVSKLQDKANKKGIYENYGEKEYRAFREKVNNNDDLSYSEKATLCSILSDRVSHINPKN